MTPDPTDGGRRLDAGQTDDALLDLAARLRRERPLHRPPMSSLHAIFALGLPAGHPLVSPSGLP
jgi:hypothetical protein